MPVKTGNTVRVHYRGSLTDGSMFDASEGRDPLAFTVGLGQVIPGFDRAVIGLEPGQAVTVTVPPGSSPITARSKPGMTCPEPTTNSSGSRPALLSNSEPSDRVPQ